MKIMKMKFCNSISIKTDSLATAKKQTHCYFTDWLMKLMDITERLQAQKDQSQNGRCKMNIVLMNAVNEDETVKDQLMLI